MLQTIKRGHYKIGIKWTVGFILWTFVFFFNLPSAPGQTLPPSMTLLYSNNINGEIDPCPV